MSTVTEVLRRFGVGLTEADVAAGLADALESLPGTAAAPLTGPEIDYLTRHAGTGVRVASWEPDQERERRAAAAAGAVERLVVGTMSIEQTATLLRLDRSRISHRLAAGALYAVTIGTRRRIPSWQFSGGAELPGLGVVVAAIPAAAHPLDVQALMTSPQEELSGRTPVEHLATGGDPAPVAELVADLARW
ncbi:hypothetical protein [Nakamurella leprariae]|uniref:DNA-binding protein n=1 Tax=Nakamurella leprariae TaxID=2803911 RepID=A0A938YEK6_9ACTN|nr:hypothetical protein [Nakamurella leprariae]MBM9468409.1 hypothetical protein [Nakamurella leprariae]